MTSNPQEARGRKNQNVAIKLKMRPVLLGRSNSESKMATDPDLLNVRCKEDSPESQLIFPLAFAQN